MNDDREDVPLLRGGGGGAGNVDFRNPWATGSTGTGPRTSSVESLHSNSAAPPSEPPSYSSIGGELSCHQAVLLSTLFDAQTVTSRLFLDNHAKTQGGENSRF